MKIEVSSPNLSLKYIDLQQIQVTLSDTLYEIKQYLHDSTILYFFTNYHFSFDGKTLNEYIEIASLNIPEDVNTLDIKIGKLTL
jgi:hypothetical protein